MNTLMKSLLVTAMALSAAHVSAHTNKTYLAPRPVGQNLAMETVAFNEMVGNKDEGRFGGNLQVTGFYSQSTDKHDNGQYFGIKNKNSFTAQTETDANKTAFPADLDASLLVHDSAAANFTDLNTITLNPSQTMFGARFDYHQDLAKLVDGLYFRVKLPVVNIKNNMGLAVANGTSPADATSINNFLTGNFTALAIANANAELALTNAQMDGDNSKTTLADLEVILGYAFLDKECYKAAINLGLVVPTGNKAEGIHAFEPVSGNGGHWALGGGLDFVARVWGDEHQNIKFNAALDYRYAFEAAEKRTLGIVNSNAGQYVSLLPVVTVGTTAKNAAQVIPAANKLTMNVDVTPGSNIDMIAGFSYNHGGLSIDLGYNLNYKEAESVSRKDSVGTSYSLLTSGTANLSLSSGAGHLWTQSDLVVAFTDALIDAGVAATPSALTNKVYGQVGYIFKDMEFPVMLAAGGHYEFANENSAIENWGVNLKAGISF